MSWDEDEMLHESDSESEFEIISLNPNIIYESEDDSPMVEETCRAVSPVKRENPAVEKNLHQEVKMKSDSVSTQTIEQPSLKIEEVKEETVSKFEESSCDSIAALDENSMNSNESVNSPKKVRKKLNLQEYKMRRANEPEKPLFDVPRKIAAYELCDVPSSLPLLLLPTDPAWIASNQKSLALDAEQYAKSVSTSFNPALFEEITIMSMGCNTEISIPPYDESDETGDNKPGAQFLSNIVNNLNKSNVVSLLNSSTSLFSSIQAVVQGKCISTEVGSEQSCEVSKESNEHGEDKIIMHLRKDRLRPFKCSIGLQTDSISLFPPLLLTPCLASNRPRKSRGYRRRISRSRSRSRSFSPSMDFERVRYNNNRYLKSQHSTHSSSMNSSDSSESSSGSDSDSSGSSSSGSSADSLKRFNDRQNFRFYNRNQNQGYNYQEERKIIYIGGLEEDTTKDEIRRKFLEYGTIKKISFHSKDDGLRYGFVTFAEASCAYEVIDKFTKDPTISKYDIRFGGRRKFCKQNYADLDSIQDSEYAESQKSTKNLSFEDLLLLAKKKLTGKK